MHTKFGIYYNTFFNSAIICISDEVHDQIIEKDNISILKKDDRVVGVNIFNIESEIFSKGYINNKNEKVINYLNLKLKGVLELKPEPQFVIGQIKNHQSIPNTHLNSCVVNVGAQELKIVCGAPNVKDDLIVVVATVGSWMPNGSYIKNDKIRGFDSSGMICSAKELEINLFNQSGIIELPKDYENKIGQDFWEKL